MDYFIALSVLCLVWLHFTSQDIIKGGRSPSGAQNPAIQCAGKPAIWKAMTTLYMSCNGKLHPFSVLEGDFF